MTSPIIDFIEARLREVQEAAERMAQVYPEPWDLYDRGWMVRIQANEPGWLDVVRLEQKHAPEGLDWLAGAIEHVAMHSPARVLREVEAKRAILAAYRPTGNDPHPGEPCTESIEHDPQGLEWEDAQNWAPCERHVKAMQERRGKPFASEHILRYLAAAWSDHPDYREEWQP